MARYLFSWLAFNNDFVTLPEGGRGVNDDGPTVNYHRHFWEADTKAHVLLSAAAGEDLRQEFLINHLQRQHQERVFIPVQLDIDDILDLPLVRQKVESLLLRYREHDLDLFFSPGNSIMQLTWYLCHTQLGLKTRLIQTRHRRDTRDGQPEKLFIHAEPDPIPRQLTLSTLDYLPPPGEEPEEEAYAITDSLKPLYRRARQLARTDKVSGLITGASGTGKEHLAHYIHRQSVRGRRRFYAVNCAAFADDLLGSELFGHVAGAYTGADKDRQGLFELASGSTLFLDEIGDISPFMQQSLLRVLQEGEIMPLGTSEVRQINVRILAATNRNLRQRCREGKFRWDLYYRLAEVELHLPAVQDRGEAEKRYLLDHLIDRYQGQFAPKPRLRLSPEVWQCLLRYPYPGNVREMQGLVKHLYVFAEGEARLEDLPLRIVQPGLEELPAGSSSSLLLDDVVRDHVVRVLQHYSGNVTHASEALGITRGTLRNHLQKYGLNPIDFRARS